MKARVKSLKEIKSIILPALENPSWSSAMDYACGKEIEVIQEGYNKHWFIDPLGGWVYHSNLYNNYNNSFFIIFIWLSTSGYSHR